MNQEVKRVVMAVFAHADDVEAHVGATLAKYHDLGYEVIYVMSTNNMSGVTQELQADGSITRIREKPILMMERRKRECEDAARLLGTTAIHLDYPQRHYNTGEGNGTVELRYGSALPEGVDPDTPSILTACEDVACTGRLADFILERDPEIIFTHGVAQVNIEHFATSLLVTNAFWKAVDLGYQGGLLQCVEGHTSHGDFHCKFETFINGDGYLDRKMELLGCHKCQMPTAHYPDHGHRQLAEWRGKVCGCETAESFNWVRRPVRKASILTVTPTPVLGELSMELIRNSCG